MGPFARAATALVATLGTLIVVAQPAAATSLIPASGNFSDVTTSVQVRFADGNTIITQAVTQTLTGTFAGTASQQNTTVVHPTGAVNFFGSETCTCVVQGISGSVVFGFSGTVAPNGSLDGQFVILSGTGGLANLNGRGTLQGLNSYTGVIHFD